MCYVSCTAPRGQGPISATHPSSLSVAAAPQAQSLSRPMLRKRGWWPARLSQPQKPPEQAPQIACLDPGIHRGEGSMMAWLGTALPTKWGAQRAGSGPSSQSLSSPEGTWAPFPSFTPRACREEKGQLQGSVARVGLPTSLQATPGTLLHLVRPGGLRGTLDRNGPGKRGWVGPGSAPCSIRVGSPAPLTEPIWGLQGPEAEGPTCSWAAGQGPEPAACEGPRQTHPSLLLTL